MQAAPAPEIVAGDRTFTWIEEWAKLPEPKQGADNQRTHAIAECRDGRVVVFRQADPAVLIYSREGKLLASWGDTFLAAHGLCLAVEGGKEILWLTDQKSGEVSKFDLDGKRLQPLAKPPHPAYQAADAYWSPTWPAVATDGSLWLADGYGMSLVHHYGPDGRWLSAIDGTESGALGRFKCPHGIAFSPRGELYVADRGNSQLQIYDAAGRFLRGVKNLYHSPCSFAFLGDLMLVPELATGVKLVRNDSELISDIGDNSGISKVAGWPNLKGTASVSPGKMNSPHGACFGADGSIFVAEWIVGGRVTKLQRKK